MVALNLWRRDNYDNPALGAAVVTVAGRLDGRRALGLRRARDVVRRCCWASTSRSPSARSLLTPLAKGTDFNATIPGFWVMGALLAWAVHWHWKGGLAAAVALSAADIAIRCPSTSRSTRPTTATSSC